MGGAPGSVGGVALEQGTGEGEKAAAETAFYLDAAKHLPGLAGRRLRHDSGQTALAHDATRALFRTATRDDRPQSRASTGVNLRNVNIVGMAAGTIDFTGAPLYGDRTGHSIVLEGGPPLRRRHLRRPCAVPPHGRGHGTPHPEGVPDPLGALSPLRASAAARCC